MNNTVVSKPVTYLGYITLGAIMLFILPNNVLPMIYRIIDLFN